MGMACFVVAYDVDLALNWSLHRSLAADLGASANALEVLALKDPVERVAYHDELELVSKGTSVEESPNMEVVSNVGGAECALEEAWTQSARKVFEEDQRRMVRHVANS